MHIAMLSTTFPKFLADSHGPWILAMARDLVAKGYKVSVTAPSASDLKKRDHMCGVEVVRFRYAPKRLEQVAYGANIPENVKNNKIAKLMLPCFVIGFFTAALKHLLGSDIVHAQFGYSGVFAIAARSLLQKKVPFVVSFYGRDVAHSFRYPKVYHHLFKNSDRVLVLSEDMKQLVIKSGCPASKVIVHHLGVDLSQFKSVNDKQDEDESIKFLVVANFVAKKGIDLAVHAFAQLCQKYPDKKLSLRLVGRGPEEAKLRQLVEFYKLTNEISFMNNYATTDPRKAVVDEMSKADIFLLPSLAVTNDYGGTPVVLMEASAMQLPVITTNDAGNAEIIINNETGLLVEEGNVQALAAAMDSLVNEPVWRRELGNKGREYITLNFNHQKQMDALSSIYQELVKEYSGN